MLRVDCEQVAALGERQASHICLRVLMSAAAKAGLAKIGFVTAPQVISNP
jgi:hypothetical protein